MPVKSFNILWEDQDLIAVEKPIGLIVDRGVKGADDLVSLVGAFAFHRLDQATSGIVLMGKTRVYAREITALFEEKRIRKAYLAVVRGDWKLSKVELPIEERSAVTTFRRLAAPTVTDAISAHALTPPASTLIEALPKTGRTHQIRIHCAASGHAILGDQRYGTNEQVEIAKAVGVNGQALHAYRLDFRHPRDGALISVRSLPETWRSTWLKDYDVDQVWGRLK